MVTEGPKYRFFTSTTSTGHAIAREMTGARSLSHGAMEVPVTIRTRATPSIGASLSFPSSNPSSTLRSAPTPFSSRGRSS